jgi:hypothetical protein
MGRVSNLQKQAEQELFPNLCLPIKNVYPSIKSQYPFISDQWADTTKETQNKRVSLPNAPTRVGSPFREAIPSRSGHNQKTASGHDPLDMQEIPEGCKRGEETELLIPSWWKTDMGETVEEKWATIQENLKMTREKSSTKRTRQDHLQVTKQHYT